MPGHRADDDRGDRIDKGRVQFAFSSAFSFGIAEQVASKSKKIPGSERVGTVVARGDAEIGFQQISELLPVPGIDYVGPLPQDAQRVTVFSAGIAVGAKEPEAARALITFLASPAATAAIKKSGLEPVTPQPVRKLDR